MKNMKQFTLIKRCRHCNSAMLVNAKTGLCWFCKKREKVSGEIEYLRIAQEAI